MRCFLVELSDVQWREASIRQTLCDFLSVQRMTRSRWDWACVTVRFSVTPSLSTFAELHSHCPSSLPHNTNRRRHAPSYLPFNLSSQPLASFLFPSAHSCEVSPRHPLFSARGPALSPLCPLTPALAPPSCARCAMLLHSFEPRDTPPSAGFTHQPTFLFQP